MTSLSDVARMRLVSQRLINPLPSAQEVVRHLTCVQGQDYPGSTTSIALRTTARRLAEVRAAYDTAHIVRSWPMRGTLFVVPAEDLGWMLSVTAGMVLPYTGRRRAELGLDPATLDQAEEVARDVLAGDGLTRADLLSRWQEAGVSTSDGRGYHLIFYLAVRGIICFGPTAGTKQRLVLNQEWITAPRTLHGEDAIAEWFTRYVRSHGPVPLADFLWWTKFPKRDVLPVLDAARDVLEVIQIDGVEYWVSPEVLQAYPGAKRATAAPMLLPGFDEIVLGYGDRRAVLTKEQEALVVPGRNGVFRATLVRGGSGLGTWKRPTRKNAAVSVEPFDNSLPADVERALPELTAALPS